MFPSLPRSIAIVCIAIAIALIGSSYGGAFTEAKLARAGGVALFAISLFATGAVPNHVAAIWFFLAAMFLHIAPAATVFSGFTSTPFWLVFGGTVIGVAVKETGLGGRLARVLALRFGASYAGVIAGTVIVGVALSFVMPSSMGRVVLLIPMVLALADRLGFVPGSRGQTGLILAVVYGTLVPAFALLPANVPNLVLAGAAETLYGISLIYGQYLLIHYPVLGFSKAIVIAALIVAMFGDKPRILEAADDEEKPMSPPERRLAFILGAALLLWVTDFVHHVSPAWISLAAASICIAPGVGVLRAEGIHEKIGYGALLYVAGILGLGAVISSSGIGSLLGRLLIDAVDFAPGASVFNFAAVSAITTVASVATTQPGAPAIMAPLAGGIAEATGLSITTVLMMVVVGFSTIMLPYQTPPIVVGLQLGGASFAAATRFSLALFVVTVVVLIPLDFLWWRILGLVP
ncbi:MAG: SLC13 family permease [Alphaproteobacteria bacterium]|nr:SLC13 family permease [Alphaproteobacteria bacterium]